MPLERVDLSEHTFEPECDMGCGRTASFIAQGCMDKAPAVLCQECLDIAVHRIELVVKMHMRLTKAVMICGDCHRPVFSLDTHIDVKRLDS